MNELSLERHFAAPPETVFDVVTRPEHLATWWGPEGMTCPVLDLDLRRLGPWMTEMRNGRGETFKVSGEVTHVEPPHSVTFTWGWHDPDDRRGHNSTVTFTVRGDGASGSVFTVTHAGLPDEESLENHREGWASSLTKLGSTFAD